MPAIMATQTEAVRFDFIAWFLRLTSNSSPNSREQSRLGFVSTKRFPRIFRGVHAFAPCRSKQDRPLGNSGFTPSLSRSSSGRARLSLTHKNRLPANAGGRRFHEAAESG